MSQYIQEIFAEMRDAPIESRQPGQSFWSEEVERALRNMRKHGSAYDADGEDSNALRKYISRMVDDKFDSVESRLADHIDDEIKLRNDMLDKRLTEAATETVRELFGADHQSLELMVGRFVEQWMIEHATAWLKEQATSLQKEHRGIATDLLRKHIEKEFKSENACQIIRMHVESEFARQAKDFIERSLDVKTVLRPVRKIIEST